MIQHTNNIYDYVTAEVLRCHAILDQFPVARAENGESLSLAQRMELAKEAFIKLEGERCQARHEYLAAIGALSSTGKH